MLWPECLCPPNSYVEILTPKRMVLFRRWLGHEVGALMSKISALIKGGPQSSLAPSTCEGHLWTRKWVLTRHQMCWHFDLRLPSLKNDEKQISVVHKSSHPVCGVLLEQPEWAKTNEAKKMVSMREAGRCSWGLQRSVTSVSLPRGDTCPWSPRKWSSGTIFFWKIPSNLSLPFVRGHLSKESFILSHNDQTYSILN